MNNPAAAIREERKRKALVSQHLAAANEEVLVKAEELLQAQQPLPLMSRQVL